MEPDIEMFRRLINYDPETGRFTWRIARKGCAKGAAVGCIHPTRGYHRAVIEKKSYAMHRVAWALKTGNWPTNCIDHINGDRADNRFCNLREATLSQNLFNRGRTKQNQSGYKGVSWSKHANRWKVSIQFNNTYKFLGYFIDPEEAHKAYCREADKLHGEFANHG